MKKLPYLLTMLVIVGVNASDEELKLAENNLNVDVEDFLKIIPRYKLKALMFEYTHADAEFAEFLDYVENTQTKNMLSQMFEITEIQEIVTFTRRNRLNLPRLYAFLWDLFQRPDVPSFKSSHGIAGFIEDIITILPLDKIEKLFHEKMKNSKIFKETFQYIKNRAQAIAYKIATIREYKLFIWHLKKRDVDIDRYLQFVDNFFEINSSCC